MNNLKLPRGSQPLLAAYSSGGYIQHTRGVNAALLQTCLHLDERPRTCYSQRRPVVTLATKFPLLQRHIHQSLHAQQPRATKHVQHVQHPRQQGYAY